MSVWGKWRGLFLRRLVRGGGIRFMSSYRGKEGRFTMHMQPGWSGVHTNRGNKVLLVQTPGIKMVGSFARCVVRQLQLGDIQEALRPGCLHTTRRTLFTPRAASTVCGASLAFFWVYQVTRIKRPKTQEFIKNNRRTKYLEIYVHWERTGIIGQKQITVSVNVLVS